MRGIRLTALALLLVSVVFAEDAPVRTAQGFRPFESPEPPLAGTPGMPVAPSIRLAPTEPPDPPTPSVAIRIRVPANVASGADITYQITVENTSRAAAHQVVVRNPLPANATFVSAEPPPSERQPQQLRWLIGTLQSREKKEITLVLKPTGAGEVSSCARVSFEHGECVRTLVGSGPTTPTETMPPRVTIPTPTEPIPPARAVEPRPVEPGRPALQLRTVAPPQSLVERGPRLMYTVEVSNPGTDTARDVVLNGKCSDGLQFFSPKPIQGQLGISERLGDIPAGQTRPVEVIVLPTGLGRQVVTFQASDAKGATQEDPQYITVGESKLEVVINGPATRFVNRPAEYLITLKNTGSIAATNVVLKSEITEGMAMLKATEGGRLSNQQKFFDDDLKRHVTFQEIQWTLGTLLPQEKRSLSIALQTKNVGKLQQRAWVEADRGVSSRSQCRTEFSAGGSGLHVEIQESADPVEVGATCEYTVRVMNQAGDAARNVGLTVEVSEHLRLVEVLKKPTEPEPPTASKITFTPLVALSAGETQEYVIKVQAVKPGDARLRTFLSGATLATPLVNEEPTRVVAAENSGR